MTFLSWFFTFSTCGFEAWSSSMAGHAIRRVTLIDFRSNNDSNFCSINFISQNFKIFFQILKMQFFKPRPPTGFNRNLVPPPIPKSQNQDKLKQLGSSSRCSQDSSRFWRLLNLASYLDFTFTHGTTLFGLSGLSRKLSAVVSYVVHS